MLRQGLCPWSASDVGAFLQAVAPGYRSIRALPVTCQPLLESPHLLYHAVGALWQAVPAPWRAALRPALPDDGIAVSLVLRSLGWGLASTLLHQPHLPSSPPTTPTPPLQHATCWQPPGPPPLLRLFDCPPAGPAVFNVKRATMQLCHLAGLPDQVITAQRQCVLAALSLAAPSWAPQPELQLCMRLQHRPVQHLHAGFLPTPVELPPQQVHAAMQSLKARLPHVWRLPWDNKWKEVWWRLLLGGLQGAGGHGVCLRGACPCGWSVPAFFDDVRGAAAECAHVMWHCPPAQAVRALLQHHLPPSTALFPQHLWLLQPPAPTIHPSVWAVVALAALHSIYSARSYMWAQRCQRAETAAQHPVRPQLRQLQLGQCPGWQCPPPPPAATLLSDNLAADGEELSSPFRTDAAHSPPVDLTIPQLAARRAVAETMAAVRDFVSGGQIPRSWLPQQGQPPSHLNGVPATHPFVALHPVVLDGQMSHELVFQMSLPGDVAA